MNKEILDTLDDLSKRPTTELAMRLMETTVDNMAKNKELENYKQRIDRAIEYINEYQEVLKEHNGDWINYKDGFKSYLLNILQGDNKGE